MGGLGAVGVGLLQCVEIDVHIRVLRCARGEPLLNLPLEGSLVADQSDGVDTVVHTDGVLVVVGCSHIGVLILYARLLAHGHVLLHDAQFDGAALNADGVADVATLLDAVAGEVAVGGTRVADGHGEAARLIALEAHGSPLRGVVGHVVLGVGCRTVGLRVGIDAEDGVVAGLARPHPVVGLATKLTHRLGYGEDQAYVGEVLVRHGVVFVALIEGLHDDVERGIDSLYRVGHGVLQRVEELAFALVGLAVEHSSHLGGDVGLMLHE